METSVDEIGVNEIGLDGMGSRRSWNKPFSLAAYHFENCLVSLNICNTIKYLPVYLC